MRKSALMIGAAAMLALLTAGCESESEALPPVRGTVSYQGAVLTNGVIVFTPDVHRGRSGPLARADIQPDGRYDLRTDSAGGAPPGWYRVTVAAVEDATGTTAPRSLLPDKYRDPELSGLECEVKAGKVNRVNFDLK